MTSIIPFNRSRVLGAHPGFTNMLDDFFNDQWPFERSLRSDTFKVDVKDCGKEYRVEAELPGVKRDEVALSIDEGRLTVSVERREESDEEQSGYIHRERRSVSMSRSVYLADAANDGVSAKLEDGILRVSLPKTVPAETRRDIIIE
jgi:HSP20 family protein